MEAIRIIRSCAKHVAEHPEVKLHNNVRIRVSLCLFQRFKITEEDHCNPDCVWVKAWFPVLFELSTIINRCKLDVRTRYVTLAESSEGRCDSLSLSLLAGV